MDVRVTRDLRLRPLVSGDLETLVAIETDPSANAHRPGGPPTGADVEQHLRAAVEDWQRLGIGYWLAERDGEPVGVAGLRPMVLHGRDCWNLYYRLRPSAWGRGLATQAAQEAVALAGEREPVLPVVARTREGNVAARAVAARAGLLRRPDPDADGFLVLAAGW